MSALFLKNSEKILVTGQIHHKMDILNKIKVLTSQYDYVIVNGGLNYYSDFEKIKEIFSHPQIIYCAGRNDLLELSSSTLSEEIIQWIKSRSNIIIVDFENRPVIIVDGGLPNTAKQRIELFDNIELSFISYIEEKPWHQLYGGKFGYAISNNPITNQPPQYYTNSLQLGHQKYVYAQEVDSKGLKQLICL